MCVPLLKSSWATNGSFCCITGGCSFLGWRGIGLKQYVEFSCKVGNGLHGLRGQCVFCSWQSTETQERIPDAVSQGKSARELAASLSGGDEGYQCQRDLPLAPGRKRKLVQHWQSTCLVFFFFNDILLVLRLLRFFHEPFGHLYIHFFLEHLGNLNSERWFVTCKQGNRTAEGHRSLAIQCHRWDYSVLLFWGYRRYLAVVP